MCHNQSLIIDCTIFLIEEIIQKGDEPIDDDENDPDFRVEGKQSDESSDDTEEDEEEDEEEDDEENEASNDEKKNCNYKNFLKVYLQKKQFICGRGRIAPKRTVIIKNF